MSAVYTRESLTFELSRLSSAPRIVPKLAALVKDPNMNPEDVIEVIRHDPALTARLIAACKSAAVNRGEEVHSVIDAVQCLGFTEVYRIAVVVAFRSGFCGRFQVYDESADIIWQRAVAAACFMEEFALEGEDDLGAAFTTGLLYMIGMFFVDWHCAQLPGVRIPTRNLLRQVEMERTRAGFGHMEISAMALEYWGFPTDIVEPIRWYLEPDKAGGHTKSARQLNFAVNLAQDQAASRVRAVFANRNRPVTTPAGNPLPPIIDKVGRRTADAMEFLRH